MRKNLLIAMLSVILVLSSMLTIFVYSTIKNNNRLVYSNMIDKNTQNQVKNVLEENRVNKKDIDIFIKSVRNYNKLQIKILQNNVNISKSGYSLINTKQVPYNLEKLQDNWIKKFPNYTDVNCRITAFRLFKDFINSKEKFTGDFIDLSIDLDTINNSRDAKFNSKDIEKYGPTSPYQVTKFKSKKDVKNYMFNRLKMSEGDVELLDPIIMENDKLMQ
ncbi:DUF4300 family protein [Clostridioides difficile]